MLETFSAAANFKSLMLQNEDMSVMQKIKVIIEQASKDHPHDDLAGILTSDCNAPVPLPLTPPKRREQRVVLSERALSALSATYKELFNCSLPLPITCRHKHHIGKISLTTRTESKRDCSVFFHSATDGSAAPGVIQYIVSIPSPSQNNKVDTFCIIERYEQLPVTFSNPFQSYQAFGADLWSSTTSPALEAIPVDHIICHAISRLWVKGAILLKALNRVCILFSLAFCVTHTLQGFLVLRNGYSCVPVVLT